MPIEAVLFILLVLLAIVIANMRDLFAAAMLFSIFSLLSAGMFTLMDAVDVAFTEAAVGAGISTVLILGTLALTSNEERNGPFRMSPVLVCLALGATLLYGTRDLPAYGDGDAVIHHHIAPEYVEGSHHIHIPNVVTTVLASYRGYDTFGETTVVFTAGLGVLLLLGGAARRRESEDDVPQAEATATAPAPEEVPS